MFVEGMLQGASAKPVMIALDAKLIEAAKLLSSGADLVMVCDSKGVLRGVLTKTDTIRQISNCNGTTCMCHASTVMTRDVALCRGSDPLQDVSELMKERHLKNVPVVDGDNRPTDRAAHRASHSPRAPERCRI
ncbi:MAG: CBS domain-containing protein [Sphingomonadaceae bacterium]|nr:CBS domain-containing protein [Sphingomonadaceae bacterium]